MGFCEGKTNPHSEFQNKETMSQKTNIHDDNNDLLNNNRKERISKHICPTAKLNPKDINN